MSERPKLLVKLILKMDSKRENLWFQILDQDESLRKHGSLANLLDRGTILTLESYLVPDITYCSVYLRGRDSKNDLRIGHLDHEGVCNARNFDSRYSADIEEYANNLLELFSMIGTVQGELVPGYWCTFEVRARK